MTCRITSTLLRATPERSCKTQQDENLDLVIMGSGELIQTLMEHNLIDRYVLLIHPLILGTGRQIFRDGSPYSALQLVSAKATPKGVVVATYEPAGATTT
jgi:dihydrofolate reductase